MRDVLEFIPFALIVIEADTFARISNIENFMTHTSFMIFNDRIHSYIEQMRLNNTRIVADLVGLKTSNLFIF